MKTRMLTKALLQSDMIVWRPLLPLLPHTGWLLNCVSLDAPPPMSCGSNPWVAMPTLHSSPIIWCAFEYIPLSWSLAASQTTFLPISSDITLAVNIDLRLCIVLIVASERKILRSQQDVARLIALATTISKQSIRPFFVQITNVDNKRTWQWGHCVPVSIWQSDLQSTIIKVTNIGLIFV